MHGRKSITIVGSMTQNPQIGAGGGEGRTDPEYKPVGTYRKIAISASNSTREPIPNLPYYMPNPLIPRTTKIASRTGRVPSLSADGPVDRLSDDPTADKTHMTVHPRALLFGTCHASDPNFARNKAATRGQLRPTVAKQRDGPRHRYDDLRPSECAEHRHALGDIRICRVECVRHKLRKRSPQRGWHHRGI
jgi:hypothetical protein